MTKKNRLFSYKDNSFFNAFIHTGMLIKVLIAIAMIVGLWYYL